MGMFSAIFGGAGSDKADNMRQKAYDAFNSIKTPELSQLQVQLEKYVSAGQLTPEQAEVQLLNSNAFNSIVSDPSLRGAQKQALLQLQDIASQGGLTAVDKAQMQDITDEQNATARGRNEAILSNTKERGIGGSGIESVNRLVSEQAAADRAARSGTDVAAQAETRALQALQAAGQLGGQMDAAQFSQGAAKATAQNAIDAFNAQTSNSNNLYNTQTANAAEGANLSNAQSINNANTTTANTNKTQNAAAYQQIYNDELQKAQGKAGVLTNWASQADADNRAENAADIALTAGAVQAGSKALGDAMKMGATGGASAGAEGAAAGYNPNMAPNQTSSLGYAKGGVVKDEPSLDDAYTAFVQKFCHGGSVKMADGGSVTIKAGKKQNMQPGGQVQGAAPVAGDSPVNDTVDAKLSPGEVVVPRSIVAKPEAIPQFVEKAVKEDPTVEALRRLRNPTNTLSVRG